MMITISESNYLDQSSNNLTSITGWIELVEIVLNPWIGYRYHHQPSSLGPLILIKIQIHHLIKVKTHLDTT